MCVYHWAQLQYKQQSTGQFWWYSVLYSRQSLLKQQMRLESVEYAINYDPYDPHKWHNRPTTYGTRRLHNYSFMGGLLRGSPSTIMPHIITNVLATGRKITEIYSLSDMTRSLINKKYGFCSNSLGSCSTVNTAKWNSLIPWKSHRT